MNQRPPDARAENPGKTAKPARRAAPVNPAGPEFPAGLAGPFEPVEKTGLIGHNRI
jgi:hypothetical protein